MHSTRIIIINRLRISTAISIMRCIRMTIITTITSICRTTDRTIMSTTTDLVKPLPLGHRRWPRRGPEAG